MTDTETHRRSPRHATACGICGLPCVVTGDVWQDLPADLIEAMPGDDAGAMAEKIATLFCPCRDRRPDA